MSAYRITRKKLREWDACYSDRRLEALVPTKGGTLLQVLRCRKVPVADRIWVATRPGACSERVQRLFAARCARRALARIKNPDPRSVVACDVAERFADGLATREELATAQSEAWRAADDDTYSAAYAAAAAAYAAAAYAADAAADAYANAAAADAAAAYERKSQIADLIDLLSTKRRVRK